MLGSVKSPDGTNGVSGNGGTFYANTWNGVATGTSTTGRLAGSKNNVLGYTYPTTGYSRRGTAVSSTGTGGQNDILFSVLLRYPMDAIDAARAAGIDLVNNGIDINAKFHFKETWDSDYVKDYLVEASPANVRVANPTTSYGFWKENGDRNKSTLGGYQTYLSNGDPVDLRYTTQENGSYTPSWYLSYSGTTKTRGSDILGQQVTFEDDTLFMEPSDARNPNSWEAMDPKEYLEEDDYEYRGFWVPRFDEYKGTYNSRLNVWTQDSAPSKDYDEYEPIYVYAKTRGAADYSLYCAVIKDSTRRGYRVYRCNGVNDSGEPILGDEIPFSYGHFALPAGTVGVRAVHDSPSPFMRTAVRIDLGVRLLASDHVREIVDDHMSRGASTFVCNEAKCDVSTLESDAQPYWTSSHKVNSVQWNRFILNTVKVYQGASKNAYVLPDADPRQQAAGVEGKQIGYVVLNGFVDGSLSTTATVTEPWQPYRPLEGTLYDLLPKGTTIQAGSIVGGYSHQRASAETWAKSGNSALSLDFVHGAKAIPEDCFTYSVYTDEATGQTMLKIHYKIDKPEMQLSDPGPIPNSSLLVVSFGFVLENPTDNILTYGTRTLNSTAFTLDGEYPSTLAVSSGYDYASNVRPLGDDAEAYKDIAEANRLSALNYTYMNWNVLRTTQTGFDKAVRPLGTVGSVPIAAFDAESEVTTGDGYEYRLRFVTSDSNRADHIVMYDVLERGVSGEGSSDSAWRGTFKGVDTSQIAGKATAGGTAKCAPVVYYSTTVTDRNSVNGAYFDLTDTGKWSKTAPSDLSAVTAIAIDCSKDAEGNDFVLDKEQTLAALVTMDSPDDYREGEAVNGAVTKFREFQDSQPATYDPEQDTKLIGSAKVTLTPTEPAIEKSSDPETGTKAEPRVVDGLGEGTIDYELRVTNSGTYDLNDVTVVDPIPEGLTFDVADITVALNGAAARPIADLGGAVTASRDGQRLTLVIKQQHPTTYQTDDEGNVVTGDDGKRVVETDKATTITIPTKVDALTAPGERRYENTARLTKANGIDLGDEYVTDTMYHKTGVVEVPVKKVWADGDNRDGIRPTSVTVNLYNGGTDPIDTYELTAKDADANGDWSHTFGLLPKFDADGKAIAYTVDEAKTTVITGTNGPGTYAYEVTGDMSKGFTVTNTHTPETVKVKVSKVWDDNNNQDGRRPESVSVTLSGEADGKAADLPQGVQATQTLNEGNGWAYTWASLYKRQGGKEIEYKVTEAKTNVITGTDGPGTYKILPVETVDESDFDFAYKVTNKHTPEKTTFEGLKDWKDSKYFDEDGKPVEGYARPSVTINLLADGAATGKSIKLDGTADANGEYEAWKYRFEDLDKFKEGKEIKYSVTETGADGYTASVSGGKVENTPKEGEELKPVTVKVKKVDALTDTGAGLAGATFTLTPPADPKSTEASESLVTDENGEAEITFTKDGTYTLEETAAPDGYEKPSTTTYTITVTKEFVRVELKQSVWTWIYNLIAGIGNDPGYVPDEDELGGTLTVADPPQTTEVRATKVWQDDEDRDGIRCDVTLDLYESVGGATPKKVEGQSKTIAKGATGDQLTVTWANLPIRRDGKAIVYSVREAESDVITGTDAPGTYAYEVTGSEDEGFTVTNTHTPETVDVPVSKAWDDGDDANGVRPASIVVRLLADGVEVDSATIEPDESGAWAHAFTGLPKYRDHGTEIAYTVEEDPVPGYEAAYDGTDITNTHEVEAVTVNPPIKKTVEGDGAPADAKFTFTMAAQPARSQLPEGMDEMPMPKGSDGQVKTVTVKGPGEYEFGEFGIERPGTYVYTMTEVDTGENGWTYDGATYTVTYVVEARDGHLSATTKIERDGKAYGSDVPEFVNSYEGKHHKRRLAQTGDPTPTYLPWLTVAGSAALACGLILSRRRRRG